MRDLEERERGRSRNRKGQQEKERKRGAVVLAAVFFLVIGVCLGFFMAHVSYSASGIKKENGAEKQEILQEQTVIGATEEISGQETQIEKENEQESGVKHQTEHLQISAGDQETEAKKGKVMVAFAGDIYLSNYVLEAYKKAGDQINGILDEGFQNQIAQADWFVANEEFPFSDRGTKAKDKQFTFRLPTENISIFQKLELDLVSLANNHALDYGTDALLDTCDTLERAGIRYMGVGANLEEAKRPVIMENNGVKIGFLGATRVIPEYSWAAQKDSLGMLETYNPEILIEKIKEVKTVCDYVVVYVHWGVEKAVMPEAYQRTMGKQYIDAGADLVVGSHPHVLQGIEYYKGKPIVYSLGNFIFGSQIPKTALLLAEFEEGQVALRLVPGSSKAGYTAMMTGEEEKRQFFQEMQEHSFYTQIREDGTVLEQSEE